MDAVKTSDLKVGDWAARVTDLPNCGGIQVTVQGEIMRVTASDMWGTASDSLTTVHIKQAGAEDWDVAVHTVHNSHTWMVRTV